MDDDKLMTLQEVAKRLNVAERTVRRMCKRGDLDFTLVSSRYRFDKIVIETYIANGGNREENKRQ